MKRILILLGIIVIISLIAGQVFAVTVLPDGETRYASFITTTTARFNAHITDDGGEPCDVRFQYYIDGGTWADNDTGWVAGYITDDQPYADVTGLSTDSLYYCRAQIKNGAGTFDGDSVAFNAYAAPEMPSKWFATPDYTRFRHAFFYGLYNYIADLASIPRPTFYMLATLIECVALGILALIIGKRLMPAVIVLCGSMALASLVTLIPMFFIAFSIIGIFGMIKMGHPREE